MRNTLFSILWMATVLCATPIGTWAQEGKYPGGGEDVRPVKDKPKPGESMPAAEASGPTLEVPEKPILTGELEDQLGEIKRITIQDQGRKKPLHTVAYETIEQMHGRSWLPIEPYYKDKDTGKVFKATDLYLSIWAHPEYWASQPIILVPYGPLRREIVADLSKDDKVVTARTEFRVARKSLELADGKLFEARATVADRDTSPEAIARKETAKQDLEKYEKEVTERKKEFAEKEKVFINLTREGVEKGKHFSLHELQRSPGLMELNDAALKKRHNGEDKDMPSHLKEAELAVGRAMMFIKIARSNFYLNIIPHPSDEAGTWVSMMQLKWSQQSWTTRLPDGTKLDLRSIAQYVYTYGDHEDTLARDNSDGTVSVNYEGRDVVVAKSDLRTINPFEGASRTSDFRIYETVMPDGKTIHLIPLGKNLYTHSPKLAVEDPEGKNIAIFLSNEKITIPKADLASVKPYYSQAQFDELEKKLNAFKTAYRARKPEDVERTAKDLRATLKALSPTVYPSDAVMDREISYNKTRPFAWAWALYLLGAVAAAISLKLAGPTSYKIAMAFFVAGLGMHVYGFTLRCLIAGRPPVSNMYESVIWVGFGAVAFGMIFELIYKKSFFMLCGSLSGFLCLVLMDLLPVVMGNASAPGFEAQIKPLLPVLRNNFWLTVHVLTITLSYSAFFLAWVLAHVTLGSHLFNPAAKAQHHELHQFIYRVMQVGVLLLSIGTILGGVWAYYSWGRFWGWDPKETWAFIALMCYLVVLHGRFTGWWGNFGMSVGAMICFQSVVMAWYGVNFVLGGGLHTYGSGAGGFEWVVGGVVLDILFTIAAAWRYKTYKATGGPTSAVLVENDPIKENVETPKDEGTVPTM